jgi:hypothetical protein
MMAHPFSTFKMKSFNENSLNTGGRRRAYTEIDDLLKDDIKDMEPL